MDSYIHVYMVSIGYMHEDWPFPLIPLLTNRVVVIKTRCFTILLSKVATVKQIGPAVFLIS